MLVNWRKFEEEDTFYKITDALIENIQKNEVKYTNEQLVQIITSLQYLHKVNLSRLFQNLNKHTKEYIYDIKNKDGV
jgi:hypothetical protein